MRRERYGANNALLRDVSALVKAKNMMGDGKEAEEALGKVKQKADTAEDAIIALIDLKNGNS